MTVPKKRAEAGILREVWRAYNEMVDYVRSLKIVPGKNTHVNHTTNGTMIEAMPGGESAGGEDLPVWL